MTMSVGQKPHKVSGSKRGLRTIPYEVPARRHCSQPPLDTKSARTLLLDLPRSKRTHFPSV